MKKLMIAAAIVCAAAFAQAASCTWGSGSIKTAKDATGGWSSTYVQNAGVEVTMNVYFIDAATYAGLSSKTQQELFNSYSTKSADLTGVNRNPSTSALIGAITINDTEKALAEDMYAVVTATYTDATYGDMFMATLAKSTYNTSTTKGAANSILSNVADWQAVPEPTSGLLLLLGVAGLALRRRRA